ncbi:sensor histidine kinase, partial [Actinomadura adrarensis]
MLGRIWNWWRGKTPLVDAFLASPVAFMSLTGLFGGRMGLGLVAYLAWVGGLLLPLVFRRTYPRAMFTVICLVSLGQVIWNVPPLPANVAVLMALYTVAASPSFRWGLVALVLTEAGAFMA